MERLTLKESLIILLDVLENHIVATKHGFFTCYQIAPTSLYSEGEEKIKKASLLGLLNKRPYSYRGLCKLNEAIGLCSRMQQYNRTGVFAWLQAAVKETNGHSYLFNEPMFFETDYQARINFLKDAIAKMN